MLKEFSVVEPADRRAVTSAIERFSLKHDKGVFSPGQRKYEELIPQESPDQNRQYAFEVDLDKCTGCKACVTACHNENGLDEDETWRSVGLVQGGSSTNPAQQHITTACHHCAEPACMKGCPTLAYTKDEETGIVRHLDDQCFGCQYCILKCPYDVPKYNKKRGIVHKCDMCIGRLSAGQAPACVRACPNGAIRITLVDKADIKANAQDYVKVPDAPASDYTYPTTKYKTKRRLPTNMESVDYYTVEPEHSHLPLVFMLVLTQLSVGAFCAEFFLKKLINPHFIDAFQLLHVPVALGIGLLALASSILHLGRPTLAYRAVLGFRTSWLSREIIAFGAFANLAILYALCYWFKPVEGILQSVLPGSQTFFILSLSVMASGLLGVFCSVQVYRDTKRPFWDNPLTAFKFFLTAVILGAATVLLTSAVLGLFSTVVSAAYTTQYLGNIFGKILCIAVLFKIMLESVIFIMPEKGNMTFIKKTAMLMAGPLKPFTLWRYGCGLAGGVLLPLMFLGLRFEMGMVASAVFAAMIFALCIAGELLERYLFFRAVVPLKMPGGS